MTMDLDNAEGWRPEPGAVIVGTILDIARGFSDQSQDFYPIITIADEKENGKPTAVHAFHHSLKTRLMDLRPVPGERIGIKFVEKRPTKDGKRTVAVYNVRVEGRSQTDVWDRMTEGVGGATGAPAPSPVTQQDFRPDPVQAQAPADDDIPF